MALGALAALNTTSLLFEKLKKANIDVLDNKGMKKDSLEVLFNPSEYTISDSVDYADEKSANGSTEPKPKRNFKGTNASSLSVVLFFDTSAVLTTTIVTSKSAKDVSKETKKFTKLVRAAGTEHEPPTVIFSWGSLNFRGVVQSIKTTYQMFTEDGKPIRAKMDLTLVSNDENGTFREPFESPDRTKCRQITEDSSIWNIANLEYENCSYWKTIARENKIENPLYITAGTIVRLPALD